MAKSKKFGTFGGVFTPSILTILGVIMYLRFPTIIGQAGLINTIAIIVIAHIISITTSLSVASLSTDKTVKTGGTYFMISRSLGLPIGGTLGFALFVGLSFSVSLYLIGFAESFLAYFDFDSSINSIRIAGTIILILVTTITFISTSLAIKSQYFIMAAILLSLLSIFFGHHDFAPKEIHLQPMVDAAPFMLLFGIFFPAVTGFEAGVSMSGDLKDPKKSLPVGAMAAVGVGFVVYLGLAFFYAYTVDAEALRNDTDILFKISLVPVLVIIGIWGATLSSALGSILGAPRILQAIAMDKIAPKMFAKGTGKTNEPRNALLLAFVIAEAGILIGELDVIARIVSMFFITTYAFLNLASAIESWSSSDFRPAFKIPKFVSILGASSAFIVMILLDFAALAGAVVVLGLLFFYLRRKELVLESGDAWSSFWTNLAKNALLKLNNQKTEKRNWRPNIVLFSGGEQARPHLVELGLALSGKLGALTDFELSINSKGKVDHKSANVALINEGELNYFKRKFACESVEAGIKAVTNVYGFSGFEPNTIMMGWSRNSENSEVLAHILSDLKKKRLSAAFLDYDKNSGFGKKENIDIWWNGKGRNLSFSLNLIRILLADPEWRDVRLRILIINRDNKQTDHLYRNTKILLDERRIEAEVKILSDDFGTRTKEMIIHHESNNADLIILGISDNASHYNKEYIDNISRISDLPASLLILSPSDEFEEINLVDSLVKSVDSKTKLVLNQELFPIPSIENKVVRIRIEKLDLDLQEIVTRFSEKTINESIAIHRAFVNELKEFVDLNLKNLNKATANYSGIQLQKSLHKQHQIFLNFSVHFFNERAFETNTKVQGILTHEIKNFQSRLRNFVHAAPETIIIPLAGLSVQKEKYEYIKYQALLNSHMQMSILPQALEQLKAYEESSLMVYSEFKKLIIIINDLYEKLISNRLKVANNILEDEQKISEIFQELNLEFDKLLLLSHTVLLQTVRGLIIEIASDLMSPDVKQNVRKKINKSTPQIDENFDLFAEEWNKKVGLLNHALTLDCQVFSLQKMAHAIISKNNDRMSALINEKVIKPFELIHQNIESYLINPNKNLTEVIFDDSIDIKDVFSEAYARIYELLDKLPAEIEIAENTAEESVKVSLQKIARYYMDTHLYEPFYRELETLENLSRQAILNGKEASSLLKFRIDNAGKDEEPLEFSYKSLNLILQDIKKQILNEKHQLNEALNTIQYQSISLLKNALSPLYSHAIIETDTEISSLLRGQKSKKLSRGVLSKSSLIKEKVNSILVQILYSSSDGMIFAKKLLANKEIKKTNVHQVLEIAENLMPEKKILSQTPVFYRTLFNSSSTINDDFWIPMEEEMLMLKKAIKRHKEGLGGAIIIKGLHGSGKTALSRHALIRYFKKDRTYAVNPPLGGSVSLEDWRKKLATAFSQETYTSDIFHQLPQESVILINDLELWWERSPNGSVVIAEIKNLIQIYGKKVLFVLNLNSHAFNQINQLISLDDILLSSIDCKAFDARQLQQLIYNRHKTSGMTFLYQNESEESLSQISMAALFNHYFYYSQGIPGVALNAWLANIIKIDKQFIYIKKPEVPNIEILDNLKSDWLLFISLFIQHKAINAHKLARLMMIDIDVAEKSISNLENSGILVMKDKEVYTLNKYLEPFLVDICLEKGII